jgi:hypothetical protein
MNVRPADLRLARKLRAAKVVYPLTTIWEARRAGLPLSCALAQLEKESGRGHNVFGHDPVKNPVKGGAVTKKRYLLYKHYRQQGLGMQGVGPCQLTYYTVQDEADKAGGCHRPKYNMRIGFKMLAGLIKVHGIQKGAARYNGAGPAADAYGRDFAAKQAKWHKFLTHK